MSDVALKIGYLFAECVVAFVGSFLAGLGTLYALDAIRHGKGAFHWKEAFRLAIALGIAIPLYSRIKSFF
ncbi:MAG: hypothetical protein KAJ81_01405 [Candidatus Latescibacteria bacterium]|nr:hypothetical protein [Candidatus Latescibacterota bacterium]MCK5327229.1 hypothetical protein [Candidatus Latescibacterota bacterium]MCK5380093.1 hypothetical protein [Candidatus Latescibacterota bacterium]MCK5732708.1 hypothetical protein [Candidatus Latescibacterota bacterium]